MRSASSADRSAICVTFSLPHENAIELQNMAHSCASQLRQLGVLAVQVGSSAAVTLQPRTGNTFQSVDHSGTLDHRQQLLSATRTNIAQYLGADISTLPPVVGSNTEAENDMHNNSVFHENVMTTASASAGVAKDQSVNLIAESSPHIVNLLQHDFVSTHSVCLPPSMSLTSVSDVRPRKRARRRTPSLPADVLGSSSMFGTAADYTDSVYSYQPPSRSVDSSAAIPSLHNVPDQFKIPEIRRKKQSRKTSVAKSQHLPVPAQAPSYNSTDSFNTGFNDSSKSDDIGMMFHTTSSYSMGSHYQINGISPYHRIPVMTTAWQTYTTHSVPSNGLHQSFACTSQYPHEFRHPQFRFAGRIDYSQVTGSRVPDVSDYRNVTPGSSVVFVSDANRMHLKGEHVLPASPTQTLRWSSANESKSVSVPYGSSSNSLIPSAHGAYNMTHDNSGSLPVSHVVQQQFVTSRSSGSKLFAETGTSACERTVHLSESSDMDRLKTVPVYDAPNTSGQGGGFVNTPQSANYQRVNGLFADVHSAALVFHGHASHAKMNGDIDCMQHADSRTPSKCETVFEKSTAVTVPPYAPLASSLPSCISDANSVPERQLQQLTSKVQQCGLTNFEDTGLNGCSVNPTSDTSKLSVSSGMIVS